MPFTLSHAAAVLPGIRRTGAGRGPLIPCALVAGSFAPDMTYYADTAIPGAMEFGQVTHTVGGVLTVDVLIAALLVALWLLLREPLVALLPARRQGRVYALLRGQPRQPGRPRPLEALRFALSAAIGAATHVLWDAFTHHDRWGTELVPALNGTVAGLPGYQFAQYGSSAVALTVLAWFTVSALRRAGAAPAPRAVPVLARRERWWAGALLTVCVLLGVIHRCARWYAYFGHISTPLDIVPTACFGAGAGLAAGLVLYGAWIRLRSAGRQRRPAEAGPAPAERSRPGGSR
ncbi:DUF4184 family protein [Streptomyces fulvorobeus]|uniref:DUF4184 domain-containing protein n=1 Tax=Streptomyces fulvorobeus TaxID=284028 RepID=A0A7J0C1U2_9ACTN|nr:DUF4184 family protein [Streptomyces fulvorobeus]NYE40204.1 hypothetical protein [Streptomyces fulvorobeus]GFM96472.1 hypothetical protein Sfulv_12830 [Streptomyces fulvorobeus]